MKVKFDTFDYELHANQKYTEISPSYRNVLDASGQAKLLNQDAMLLFCITFSSTRSPSGLLLHFLWPLFPRVIYVLPPVNPDEHPNPALSSFLSIRAPYYPSSTPLPHLSKGITTLAYHITALRVPGE